jgi:prophage regulatory protein
LELAGRFPRSVAISEGRIAWIESEVDSWIADKVARRDDGSAVRLPHSGIAAKAAPAPEVAPARSPRARTRDKVSAGQGPASGG